MRMLKFHMALLVVLVLSGCAAHSNLSPLGKGNFGVNVGIGGPFIDLASAKIPTPYLTLGCVYGLNDRVNLDANLHISSLFYKIAGLDFGAAYYPTLNDGITPTWGIQPRLLIFASLKDNVQSRYRVYPILSTSGAWQYGKGLVYTGLDMTMRPYSLDYDTKASGLILSPFAGYQWHVGEKTSLQGELKWHAANIEGNQLAPGYLSVGGQGALSLILSVSRRF